MPRKHLATALLVSSLGLGIMPAAFAAAPYDLDAGVRVSDTTSSLGDTSALKESIQQLATDDQVNLFVVTIDAFESPTSSGQWVEKFASLNNMGTNDVVLVIATEDRQAYFLAGSTSLLSAKEQEKIYQDYIYPELAKSDYKAAAQAAVTGIKSQLGSGAAGTSTGAVAVGATTLISVGVLGGAGALLWSRKRSSKTPHAGQPSGTAAPQAPLPSLAELRTQAGQQLVSTDDAIAHSLQEVEFARLQYGEEEVAPFLNAIKAAKEHMQQSFQLQKQLEDDIPDTEADQRAWLTEIISRTQQAQASLNEQVENFTKLRKLEENAPQVLATLKEQIRAVDPLFAPAQAALGRLKGLYAPSAYGAIADNIEEAQSRLEFARSSAQKAQELLATDRSQAILELRAGEEALGQAKGLLESVHHAETDLAKMAASLDDALILAERDVAQAQELARTGAGSSSQLSGAAAGVQAVLGQIRAERAGGLIDPYLLNQRLHEVRSELDAALAGVRQVHEQEQNAREKLAHTLLSAQARVSSAGEYVWARRGGVKAEARTRLREAERHLAEAQELQSSDPVTALSHANDAIRLATDAQRIAENDVNVFSQNNRGYRGNTSNSAMLGGILLGTLLGGGSSQASSGSSWGGGSFGGGFGGGGFSSGGGFGSGGGAGGNF
ncbi:TPM domain-containing protein [Rothia sp. CCM 9417]|uniref:TPM domain-containing protein n=1 Tax=Rothia sp. CCM 9417 TaxID=3402657 RepID=UPI003AE64698